MLIAAEVAISRAGISKEEVDLVICATVTPDYLCMPSTACLIASKLGLPPVMAFDLKVLHVLDSYCRFSAKHLRSLE